MTDMIQMKPKSRPLPSSPSGETPNITRVTDTPPATGAGSGAPYIVAVIALLTLTGASLLSSRLHLGAASAVIPLAIAAVKASIVAWVFMHLNRAGVAIRFVLVVTALFIITLSLGMGADVGLR